MHMALALFGRWWLLAQSFGIWTQGCASNVVPSLPQQHPGRQHWCGVGSEASPQGECGQSSRSKNARVALLKLPPPAPETLRGREAWSIPVKIMDYSEHQGFPPSSVCCLHYSAGPRHYINEILSEVCFSRFCFLYLFSAWTVPHPSQTNSKAERR